MLILTGQTFGTDQIKIEDIKIVGYLISIPKQ
jgi:hypothetical protein